VTHPHTTRSVRRGLGGLREEALDSRLGACLEAASARNGGSAAWQARKIAELHDMLAIQQMGGPIRILGADLSSDLQVMIEMRAPVPCRPDPAAGLRIAPQALLGLVYRHEATHLPQPGASFVFLLAPEDIWHPNVGPPGGPVQALCLGPTIPPGFPVKHLLLLTYISLTMMSAQFDQLDAAGVLNPEAADWWQHNARLLPLSREPFLPGPARPNHGLCPSNQPQ